MSRGGSRTRASERARRWGGLLLGAAVVLGAAWFQGHRTSTPQADPARQVSSSHASQAGADALPAFLPEQARRTLALIARGGPYPYPQDGSVFGNYEGHLPAQPRGWYHEYTVQTPGLSHRGTRRIITGGTPPKRYWYTDDHYASFRAFEVPRP